MLICPELFLILVFDPCISRRRFFEPIFSLEKVDLYTGKYGRSVIQVVLILFQIGMICSVLNFWDQQPCRCMETCTSHRRVNLLIC